MTRSAWRRPAIIVVARTGTVTAQALPLNGHVTSATSARRARPTTDGVTGWTVGRPVTMTRTSRVAIPVPLETRMRTATGIARPWSALTAPGES